MTGKMDGREKVRLFPPVFPRLRSKANGTECIGAPAARRIQRGTVELPNCVYLDRLTSAESKQHYFQQEPRETQRLEVVSLRSL